MKGFKKFIEESNWDEWLENDKRLGRFCFWAAIFGGVYFGIFTITGLLKVL